MRRVVALLLLSVSLAAAGCGSNSNGSNGVSDAIEYNDGSGTAPVETTPGLELGTGSEAGVVARGEDAPQDDPTYSGSGG